MVDLLIGQLMHEWFKGLAYGVGVTGLVYGFAGSGGDFSSDQIL